MTYKFIFYLIFLYAGAPIISPLTLQHRLTSIRDIVKPALFASEGRPTMPTKLRREANSYRTNKMLLLLVVMMMMMITMAMMSLSLLIGFRLGKLSLRA